MQLQVTGDTLLWRRGNGQFSESAQAQWLRSGFEIDASGAWSPGSGKQGRWRTVGSLRLDGNAVTGAMRQISPAGDQMYRQCSANIPVALAVAARTMAPPAPLPQLPHDPVRAQALGCIERMLDFVKAHPQSVAQPRSGFVPNIGVA